MTIPSVQLFSQKHTQQSPSETYPKYRDQQVIHPKSGLEVCGFRSNVNYIDSKSNHFFNKKSLAGYSAQHDSANHSKNREKNVRHEAMPKIIEQSAGKELMSQEEAGSIEAVDIDLEGAVLYQGRKNHDHCSNEGRKYKKYNSEGTKISRSRDARPLMVSLKEVGEVFGQHLNEVACRKKRYENYSNILSGRSFSNSAAEYSRYVKSEIKEGIQEHCPSTQRAGYFFGYESGVDPEYEAYMKAEYDDHEQNLSNKYSLSEAMHNAREEEARQYEALLAEEFARHDAHLEEDRDQEAREADRHLQIERMVHDAEQEELQSDITLYGIYADAKRKATVNLDYC